MDNSKLIEYDAEGLSEIFGGYRSEPDNNVIKDLDGATILVSIYDTPPYEGYAFVLYEKDGELFEVSGSHCSCYGLEDQWKPDRTTWKALDMREFSYGVGELREELKEFISSNL